MNRRYLLAALWMALVNPVSAQTSQVVVNTIANMQALSGATYPNVKTLSYSALGDNGGASFHYDGSSSATANGCTVFTASPSGRWIADAPPNPFPSERCGVQDRSGSDQSVAVQRLFNLNMPVIFHQNGVTRIDSGVTFDANYVRVDCAGGQLDFSHMSSGTAFTITTDTVQPEYLKAHNFDHCVVTGPATNVADVTGFQFTPKVSSGSPQFNAFTFSNGGASGFRTLTKLGNGTQFISWENYTYSNQTAACGTFIRLTGTSNAGEMYKGANLAVIGCENVLVDAVGAPDAEFTCDGCSFDFMDRVLTGDNGSGPGSTYALAGISHFCCHWENPNSIVDTENVWVSSAYGAGFVMDSGGYMRLPDPDPNGSPPHSRTKPYFRIDSPVNGRGLVLRDVLISPPTHGSHWPMVEGSGGVSISRLRTYDESVLFFAPSTNGIADYNLTATGLTGWDKTASVSRDTTTKPSGATASLKLDATGSAQYAIYYMPCSAGQQYGARAKWKTSGSGNIEEWIYAIGAGNNVLDQNSITANSLSSFTDTARNASRGAPAGTVQVAVKYVVSGPSTIGWVAQPELVCQ